MSKLIAQVATAVIVNGERTIIQPGQELPELHPHDAHELLQSGAAKNPDYEAAERTADARAQAAAAAQFERERERVRKQTASTASDATDASDADDKPAAAHKTGARK